MGEMFGEKLGGLEIGGGCKVSAGATVPSQPKTSTVRCHQDVTNSQEQNKSLWSHKIQRSVLKCTFLRFLTASKS